ncbi:MAG TPA: nuclear transport factor 2 family protein [Gaiellaceae bacterium]
MPSLRRRRGDPADRAHGNRQHGRRRGDRAHRTGAPALTPHTAIDAFFAAMNTRDADAAAAVVDPDVEIMLGPHALTGQAAVRELALQEDPQLVFENLPVNVEAQSDTRVVVAARRTSHWRESGELAAQDDYQVVFDLGADGLITRIEMS